MDNKIFLFPLQNSVLFKRVTLPYHIFEARYRKMITDACEQQIPVGIVSYHSSNDYTGEVCIAGIPHILSSYPDGRMDIYITGAMKCRITDFEEENPYKVYSYRELDEELEIDESYELELESLKLFLKRWALHFLPDPVQRENFIFTLDEPEILVNYCAVFLVDDAKVKKEVMVAESMKEKVKILLHVMGPKKYPLDPLCRHLSSSYFFLVVAALAALPAAIAFFTLSFFFAWPLRRDIFTALLLRPKPIVTLPYK